jgi:hypothetical protein
LFELILDYRDLKQYQTQFNEHMHQYLKDAAARLTNGQCMPAEEVEVSQYDRLVGGEVQEVPAHNRTVKTTSTAQQLMVLSVVKKDLRAKCLSTAELEQENARTMRKEQTRKRAGDAKLERDIRKMMP